MTAISITPGYPTFADTDGSPLNDGYVYIGLENQDPITAPTGAFWDKAFQVPADQPLRTSGGYIVRNGTPAAVYTGASYSILVQNKNLVTVYNAPSAVITNVTNNVEEITQYQGAHATDPIARNDGTPLEVGDLYFNTVINELKVWTGSAWVPASPGAITVQNFTGTGAQTGFNLASAPVSENNTQIYIDGVYQQKDTYTVAGATINFSTAPPYLSGIEVVTFSIAALGTVDASNVSYNEGSLGAVNTSVQAKLQENVSVKDFGAVGDGVTDDTVAIQAACTANLGKTIFFPQGNYLVSSTIDLTGLRVRLLGEGAAFGSNRGTKLIFTAASGDMFNCDANYYMTVRNLGINGDPSITYATTNRCFVINNITHMLFENVNIEGFNDAIVQDLTSGINFHLTINQCNISDCYYALYIKKSCNLITITNSFFSNNGYGVRVENSDNVSFQSTAIQVQGMGLARGREATNSYNFRFDTCGAVGFDNCYFEVNAFDTVGSPVTPGTQYMGQINNCNGFNFKNSYVVGSTAMDATVNLFQFTDTAGASLEGNYFYRFNSNMTLCSANATGSQNRHLINRASNVVNSTMKVIDNSYPPVLYLNNAEPTSPVPTYGAGNTGRTFFDGSNFRYVGTMIVTNWAALVAAGASSDYIGIKVPTAIDVASHGSLDQVAIGSGFWNGAGVLINAIEDTRPNIIRVKVNGWGTNLTSGDAPTYISFDVTYQPEILAT
jgi:hypothetical protein